MQHPQEKICMNEFKLFARPNGSYILWSNVLSRLFKKGVQKRLNKLCFSFYLHRGNDPLLHKTLFYMKMD